jgi:hypothetical protein
MNVTRVTRKLTVLWLCGCLSFGGFVGRCSAFPTGRPRKNKNYHTKICKNIRVRCKLFAKRNYNDVKSDKSMILNNLYSIVKDDISNDILYYLKFYHLTNDDTASYFYIVFYELINLSLSKEKDKLKSLPVSISNIILYMVLKNIILQHFLNH